MNVSRQRLGWAWRCPIALLLVGARTVWSQGTPPVRALGAVLATSPVAFGSVAQIMALSDGHVFVSDAARHRLYLLDSTLSNPRIVLDSAPGQSTSYRNAILFRFRGDSALVYDGTAKALVAISPDGAIGRVLALPTGQTSLSRDGQFGPFPASSPIHGLIYSKRAPVPEPQRPADGAPDMRTASTDSAFILRMNYTNRAVDTVAKLAAGGLTIFYASAHLAGNAFTTPMFPFIDDVVTLTDGSIVLYHAREFRLEWIHPDGTRSSTKLAYDWRRVPDAVRDHLLDSANARRRAEYDSMLTKRAADSSSGHLSASSGVGPDGSPLRPSLPILTPLRLMMPDEFPDFYPPTTRGAILADGGNDVWIRPVVATPVVGGTVWNVIDPQGRVTDRILIPTGLTIAGFGAKGIVYVTRHDAGTATLQAMRWR